MPARLEIQPEVKTSAASLPWRSASSRLELHDRMMGAGDVAGAAGAGAVGARRLDARLDHVGMAAHAEIIVRAPDGDFARRCSSPAGRQSASGKRARRVRDRRRCDSALRASASRSPFRNRLDSPSVLAPFSTRPKLEMGALVYTLQRLSGFPMPELFRLSEFFFRNDAQVCAPNLTRNAATSIDEAQTRRRCGRIGLVGSRFWPQFDAEIGERRGWLGCREKPRSSRARRAA